MTLTLGLRINPEVKLVAAREAYLRDGFVQIPNFFTSDVAEHLANLIEALSFDLVMQGPDKRPLRLTQDQVLAEGEGFAQRLDRLMSQSGTDYGFLYQVYPLISAYLEGRDPGHPIHRLTEWLNSGFARFGAMVTDQPKVAKADGQITRYRPGDFIGLHTDASMEEDTRLTAYTLGFTREWRSDWGGQLLFHDDKGDLSRGYMPGFNTLTLFKVPQLHSVATVAPYAKAYRHSVVGWLREHK